MPMLLLLLRLTGRSEIMSTALRPLLPTTPPSALVTDNRHLCRCRVVARPAGDLEMNESLQNLRLCSSISLFVMFGFKPAFNGDDKTRGRMRHMAETTKTHQVSSS